MWLKITRTPRQNQHQSRHTEIPADYKVLFLVDGDLTLGDSKVICQYLEEAYPEPALYPKAIADRARAHW